MLNKFLQSWIEERIAKLPASCHSQIYRQAQILTELGVDNDKDLLKLQKITLYAKGFLKTLSLKPITESDLADFSKLLYKESQLSTFDDFYHASVNVIQKMQIPIKKTAYPQVGSSINLESTRNVQKWMESMRHIYAYSYQGVPFQAALDQVTKDWDVMEKKDFVNWLKFYQDKGHQKYKTAQQYYQVGPGAVLPLDHLRAELPGPMPDMSQFEVSRPTPAQTEAEKKEQIKKKVKSIVGRLNAAERLATDPEVQKELQRCLEIGVGRWLEELQKVKRMVQLAPMRSAASPILEDLMIRHANCLRHEGLIKAGELLVKIAQMSPPEMPAEVEEPIDDGESAIKELIEGMNNFDSAAVEDDDMEAEDGELTVIAQALPSPEVVETPVAEEALRTEELQPAPQAEIEVEEEGEVDHDAHTAEKVFDNALDGVTVGHVIESLESLANIFRNREISRQIAMVDLMMHHLGIATFFPSLAEASSKTLESNQYALTRIEDILSKLRGSASKSSPAIDLKNDVGEMEPIPSVNPESLKQNLTQEQAAEKARKQRRKEEENAAFEPEPAPAPPELTQPAPPVQSPVVPPARPQG